MRDYESPDIGVECKVQAAIDALAIVQSTLFRSRAHVAGMGQTLAEKAQHIRYMRDYRAKLFEPEIFGEPAWDILLDLFISAENGRHLSVSAASMTDNISQTTGLRWLGILERKELIERTADERDRRRDWISLRREAHGLMCTWLSKA